VGRLLADRGYRDAIDGCWVEPSPTFLAGVAEAALRPWRSGGGSFRGALKALNRERRANLLPWTHVHHEGHQETYGLARLRLGGLLPEQRATASSLRVTLQREGTPSEVDITRYLAAPESAARGAGGDAAHEVAAYRVLDVPRLVADLEREHGEGRFGYHVVRVRGPGDDGSVLGSMRLIVAPERAHQLPEGARYIALEAPVSALNIREAGNLGMGDLGDLRRVTAAARAAGFDGVLTPPTSLIGADDAGPYASRHRGFGEPRMVNLRDLAALLGYSGELFEGADGSLLARTRAAVKIEPADVSRLTRSGLVRLLKFFHSDRDGALATLWAEFQAWCSDPSRQPALDAFAQRQEPTDLELAKFTEWAFQRQERAVQDAAVGAREDGARPMSIGRIKDMAVVAASQEVDEHPGDFLRGLPYGAPRDGLSPDRPQIWGGLLPNPLTMFRDGYRRFAALVGEQMASAGMLRFDHIFSLARMFTEVPAARDGRSERDAASRGGYLRYPRDHLFAVLALESQRRGCVVLGENLGTEPAGFQGKMESTGLLGYTVMQYLTEPRGAVCPAFVAPAEYPRGTLAALGTWDGPSLGAVWEGLDLSLRYALGRLTGDEVDGLRELLPHRRYQLLDWLRSAGTLPAGVVPEDAGTWGAWSPALDEAAWQALARAPAAVVAVSLFDATGATMLDPSGRCRFPFNVPGAWEGDPRGLPTPYRPFRQRLPVTTEAELGARLAALSAAVQP
jgi:4-alpha-glucanotransferase